ncbi:hypothetical protein ScPMuIL_003893 [Solemya velum]
MPVAVLDWAETLGSIRRRHTRSHAPQTQTPLSQDSRALCSSRRARIGNQEAEHRRMKRIVMVYDRSSVDFMKLRKEN